MSTRGLLRLIALPVAVPTLLSIMLLQPTAARADTTMTMSMPFTDSAINYCSSPEDVVAFSGFFHETMNFSVDLNGKTHAILMQHYADLKGVGAPSLTPYVVTQTDNLNIEISSSDTITDTNTVHENVISQGGLPNFL